MRARGFSDQELDLMTRQNPARLLGLPAYVAPRPKQPVPLQHTWPWYPMPPRP
jgi:hypothetical protein